MKEKGVLGRLFQHMGMFRITMVIAIVLSAVSSVINLYAFVCVYNVAKEIIQSLGNISSLDQTYMVDMGWRAVFLILVSFGLYGLSLLFSQTADPDCPTHWKSAFGVSHNKSQRETTKNH